MTKESQQPHNLFFVTERPALSGVVNVMECRGCGSFHREAYTGDCRNVNENFPTVEDAATVMGVEVVEVFEELTCVECDDVISGEAESSCCGSLHPECVSNHESHCGADRW